MSSHRLTSMFIIQDNSTVSKLRAVRSNVNKSTRWTAILIHPIALHAFDRPGFSLTKTICINDSIH